MVQSLKLSLGVSSHVSKNRLYPFSNTINSKSPRCTLKYQPHYDRKKDKAPTITAFDIKYNNAITQMAKADNCFALLKNQRFRPNGTLH